MPDKNIIRLLLQPNPSDKHVFAGALLRKLRQNQGLTMEDMLTSTCLSKAALKRIEADKVPVDWNALIVILTCGLGCSIAEIDEALSTLGMEPLSPKARSKYRKSAYEGDGRQHGGNPQ